MTDEIKEETPKEEVKEEEKTPDFLTRAEELYKGTKENLEKYEALFKRNEEIAARNILGGGSEAGQPVEEKKELSPKEYKDKIEKEGFPDK